MGTNRQTRKREQQNKHDDNGTRNAYNSDFQHKEYRTGHKYTTTPEQLKETTDARLMQQEVDKKQ
jgi:hypothetical protein